MRCDPAGATTVEFVDGTVLDLSVREGEVGLRRLAATPASVIYLQAAEPCFGSLWYRLLFVSLFEDRCVMARVRRLEGVPGPDCSRID